MSPRFILATAVPASLLAFLLHVALHSPISPLPLPLPTSNLTANNVLQKVIKLGEGRLVKPETVCVDQKGTLYTATRDGWIKRMHADGSWEDWKMIGGEALLGITVSMDGDLLVCDADKGLLKVGEEGITVLASEVDGTKIRERRVVMDVGPTKTILLASPSNYATYNPLSFSNDSFVNLKAFMYSIDDAIEAPDGSVYFSDASTKFGLHEWFFDVLEAKPHGRLLKYDPSTNTTSIILADLGFANGVALSSNGDFLVVCETWKFRCLKYWLKGELIGKTEVFIDNLPGGPDNINLAPDGSFWIALLQLRSRGLDLIHGSSPAKRVLTTFPKLVEIIKPMNSRATVINVASDGRITRIFGDSNGRVMSFVTSAMEFEDHLYLGSLNTNFVGKLFLKGLGF